MSNARDFAARVPVDGALSNRNLIINGAMQVAQRGTSVSPTSTGQGMHLDRFSVYAGNGEIDYARSTEAPSGFVYSLSISPNTANASPASSDFRVTLRHKIEGYNASPTGWGTSNGKTCILSFWMKTNKTGIHPWFVTNYAQTTTFQSFIDVTNTDWNYYKKVIPAPSSGHAFNLGTSAIGIDFQFNFGGLGSTYTTISSTDASMNTWTGASPKWGLSDGVNFDDSTSNQMYITGVQLEVGDTATDFEHEPYSVTLQKCMRYFQRYEPLQLKGTMATGSNFGRNGAILPVEMRSTPTITLTSIGTSGHNQLYDGLSTYTFTGTISANYSNTKMIELDGTVTSSTTGGRPAVWYSTSAYKTRFDLSAEL